MSTGSTGSLSQTIASAHILAMVAPRSTPDISPSTSSQPMVLSSTLPPIATKLVAKIQSGQFVAMKELLADNMSLCQQVEAWPAQHVFTGAAKPRLRDVHSPLNWVSCFLAYAEVRTPDPGTRKLLTYGRLVVREAQRHSGQGWLDYDKIFRQHAALDPGVLWQEINSSLHASTILSYRVGPSQVYSICHEPDHMAEQCAMQVLQPQRWSPPSQQLMPPRLHQSRLGPPTAGPVRTRVRPETLERICVSWNKGRCTFPACNLRHICATCKRRGHRAKECEETSAESPYKSRPAFPPRAGSGGNATHTGEL